MHKAKFVASLFSLLFAAILVVGCAGNRARDGIGVPTVNTFADAIIAEAAGGIAAMPESEQSAATAELKAFEVASASSDRQVIATQAWSRWATVREFAEAGITAQEADGLIGSGVAASKRERLNQYEKVLKRTAGLPP